MAKVVTDILDLAGLLLMVVAAAVLTGVALVEAGLAAWSLSGLLSVGGAGLLLVSWLIDRRAGR